MAVTVNYSTQHGNTDFRDFDAVNGSVTFGVGESSKQITILSNYDTTVESDERFYVNITPVGAGVADGQGRGIISNDDFYNQPGIPEPNTHLFPIGFDLNGDGLDLISIDESLTTVLGTDGSLTRIGWLGGDDGFLALDRDGDGTINTFSEISFVQDLEGATTDFEGLRAYDTNADGVFDAQDERFGEFQIWRDINQDGQSAGEGELLTLETAGITSISLELQSTGRDVSNFADSVVLNTAEYTTSDGQTHTAYDVALAASLIEAGVESNFVSFDVNDSVLNGTLGQINTARLESEIANLESETASLESDLGGSEADTDVEAADVEASSYLDYAGLENVSVDSAARFIEIATQSDWGQVAGHRSQLLSQLTDALAEQASEEEGLGLESGSSGIDLGLSQDELLADFEANAGGTDEDGVDAEAADEEAADEEDSSEGDGSLDAGLEAAAEDGALIEKNSPSSVNPDYIKSGEDLRAALGGVASVVDESSAAVPVLEQPIAASLDQFTQAMASFGGSSSFEGLNLKSADPEAGQDLLAQGQTNLLQRQSILSIV